MSGKFRIAGLLIWIALAGCEKEVILEGERFPVLTDLTASIPVEGEPAPVAGDTRPENLSVPIALPPVQSNAEWTHRGGNAQHSSVHGALSSAPQRIWSTSIGNGNSRKNRISASPVVANGRVFAMDAGTLVTALSTSGAQLWQADLVPDYDTKSDVSGGGLATADGKVYATTGFGELVALDAASGAVVWRQRLEAPVTGAPTVAGGAVYVVGRDGSATALAVQSGRILWRAPGAPATTGVIGASSPSVAGDKALFPYASGQLTAVNVETGDGLWNAAVAGKRTGRAYAAIGDLTGDPVVVDGVVYAGSAGGRVVAIEAETGMRIWTALEGALNPPLVVGGSVFVVNDLARLVRLDAATGQVIWSVDMPYYRNERTQKAKTIVAHFGPVLAGGRLVVASSDGPLRFFSPTDGALLGQAEIPGGAASSPALAGGVLYVVGGKGQLHAFR